MKKLLLLPVFFLALMAYAYAGVADMPEVTSDATQAFVNGAIVVKGEGSAPERPLSQAQRRILALRAAKVVALREAAEVIDGVTINGDTTIENASAHSDTVRTAVQGVIKGAVVIREVYDPLAGLAVVYVSVPMAGERGLMGALLPQVSGLAPALTPFQAAGAGLSGGYDGVIVDARDVDLRPALINRIVTKSGEVIYDPSKAHEAAVREKGPAAYTNSVEKARGLLSDRGSHNPIVVKAESVNGSTDAVLSASDAAAVFSSNQAANFLDSARVVFVLK